MIPQTWEDGFEGHLIVSHRTTQTQSRLHASCHDHVAQRVSQFLPKYRSWRNFSRLVSSGKDSTKGQSNGVYI